jgi:hypothetical protein
MSVSKNLEHMSCPVVINEIIRTLVFNFNAHCVIVTISQTQSINLDY